MLLAKLSTRWPVCLAWGSPAGRPSTKPPRAGDAQALRVPAGFPARRAAGFQFQRTEDRLSGIA